jgi:uncharacterized protein
LTPLRQPAPGDDHTDPGSPCTSVCRIDPGTGWCTGCLRTIDGIIDWGAMGAVDKRRVWQALEHRARAASAPSVAPPQNDDR